jgi:hypothetical protein
VCAAYLAKAGKSVVVLERRGVLGGAAVTDVICEADPDGRLPVSLPRTVGQLPVQYRRDAVSQGAYVATDAAPLFPFGHGESYAAFTYDDFSVEPATIPTDGSTTAVVTVGNAAYRPGTAVVQLYAHRRGGSRVAPVRELVGFQRLDLAGGERATVEFELSTATLARHDAAGRLVVEPGEVDLAVGTSASELAFHEVVALTGEPFAPTQRNVVAATTVTDA